MLTAQASGPGLIPTTDIKQPSMGGVVVILGVVRQKQADRWVLWISRPTMLGKAPGQ